MSSLVLSGAIHTIQWDNMFFSVPASKYLISSISKPKTSQVKHCKNCKIMKSLLM